MVQPTPEKVYVDGNGQLMCRINTNMGAITAKLFEKRAPKTVANFVGLANGQQDWQDPKTGQVVSGRPLYNGVIFHRVIPGFMIQGGDPTGTGRGGPGYRFADEFHPELRHTGAGILSMANAGPNTNGSQFFICDGATPHLNDRHSVFGQVTEGLDVVKQIANAPRDGRDRPNNDVVIQSIDVYRA